MRSVARHGPIHFYENRHLVQNLEGSKWVVAPLKEKVEEAEEIARGYAPVATGAYRDGIKADQVWAEGKWISRLNAYDFKSAWIEFGTSRMPAFAILRNAMEAAGLHFIDPKNDVRAPTTFKRKGKTVKQYRHAPTGRFTK